MIDRLDENCKGCRYDGTDDGAYFCLSCTLIGKFVPHTKKDAKKEHEEWLNKTMDEMIDIAPMEEDEN